MPNRGTTYINTVIERRRPDGVSHFFHLGDHDLEGRQTVIWLDPFGLHEGNRYPDTRLHGVGQSGDRCRGAWRFAGYEPDGC